VIWALAAAAAAVLAVLAAAWFSRGPWSEKGLDRREVGERIRTVLLSCEPGAVAVCRHEGSEVELRLVLEEVADDEVAFAFRVARAPWSAGLEERHPQQGGDGPLEIRAAAALDGAAAAAAARFSELADDLGLGGDARFRVHVEGHCSGPRARAFLRRVGSGTLRRPAGTGGDR